jgi:ornithine cyclodeaminase/alanine dehydrogenase-like protein (mu-crystallin family)
MPLLLSEADVKRVLSMADLIEAMEPTLAAFSARQVEQPLRTVLQAGSQKPGFFGVMPAFIPATGALGTKLVTVFASNAEAGLPTHLATIVLLDSATGALLAIMDGRYITEARTAAVSAVATRHLANADAGTLAIIGSGVQARSHLEALSHVRTLADVRVWSPDAGRRAAFVREMKTAVHVPLSEARSARQAVDGASIVVLATSSRDPVIESDWVSPGTHVCAVGACRPDQREMDSALVARARVFVDSRVAALAEAGDLVIPIRDGAIAAEHIAGELGELAAGAVAGRESPAQVTIFKSLGLAVEDVAAAHIAYQRANARGLGTVLAL